MKRFWLLVLLLTFCIGFRVDAQENNNEEGDALDALLAGLFADPLALYFGWSPFDKSNDVETDTIELSETENRILEAIVFREVWLEDIKENKAKMCKHLVQKGEDWESVAAIYGVTKGDLTAVNPFIGDCYAGMEIDVPMFLSEFQIKENRLVQKDAGYILAKEYYDAGDYKKALKQYDNIEKSGKSTLLSRYNRGLCCFRLGKFGKCVSDMEYVVDNDTDNSYPNAKQIIDKANTAIAERNERIANTIGNIVQGGLQAYGQYAYMKQMQEWQSNGISPSGEIIDPSKLSNEYKEKLLDPDFAVQQAIAQKYREAQMYSGYKEYEANFQKNLFVPQDWGNMHGAAGMQQFGPTDWSNPVVGDFPTEPVSLSNYTTYGRENYETDCYSCHGTGNCPTCSNGIASGFGLNHACANCRSNPGKCSTCRGTGKITKTRSVEIQH